MKKLLIIGGVVLVVLGALVQNFLYGLHEWQKKVETAITVNPQMMTWQQNIDASLVLYRNSIIQNTTDIQSIASFINQSIESAKKP